MEEVGIYRLSGATSEVRRLKDAFDNSKYILCPFVMNCSLLAALTKEV